MLSTALKVIERREWPRTEAKIHLLSSAMFEKQAIIRDMEKTGREQEIGQISRNISKVAPKMPVKSTNYLRYQKETESNNP